MNGTIWKIEHKEYILMEKEPKDIDKDFNNFIVVVVVFFS